MRDFFSFSSKQSKTIIKFEPSQNMKNGDNISSVLNCPPNF